MSVCHLQHERPVLTSPMDHDVQIRARREWRRARQGQIEWSIPPRQPVYFKVYGIQIVPSSREVVAAFTRGPEKA